MKLANKGAKTMKPKHTHYQHDKGRRGRFSTPQRVIIAIAVFFFAISFYNLYDTWRTAQIPKPLTYGQIVDRKNECYRAGMSPTIYVDAKTSKVIAVTCGGVKYE